MENYRRNNQGTRPAHTDDYRRSPGYYDDLAMHPRPERELDEAFRHTGEEPYSAGHDGGAIYGFEFGGSDDRGYSGPWENGQGDRWPEDRFYENRRQMGYGDNYVRRGVDRLRAAWDRLTRQEPRYHGPYPEDPLPAHERRAFLRQSIRRRRYDRRHR